MTEAFYWIGDVPAKCQLTDIPFHGVMYDCNLLNYGWGCYCHDAFVEYKGKLGPGLGQKYSLQNDGRWLKVEG